MITNSRHQLRSPMFSFLKRNPVKKLEKQHAALLEHAMQAQRNGD
ncbi:DUF6435 family protein, partial [Thalassolituus sp.]